MKKKVFIYVLVCFSLVWNRLMSPQIRIGQLYVLWRDFFFIFFFVKTFEVPFLFIHTENVWVYKIERCEVLFSLLLLFFLIMKKLFPGSVMWEWERQWERSGGPRRRAGLNLARIYETLTRKGWRHVTRSRRWRMERVSHVKVRRREGFPILQLLKERLRFLERTSDGWSTLSSSALKHTLHDELLRRKWERCLTSNKYHRPPVRMWRTGAQNLQNTHTHTLNNLFFILDLTCMLKDQILSVCMFVC